MIIMRYSGLKVVRLLLNVYLIFGLPLTVFVLLIAQEG